MRTIIFILLLGFLSTDIFAANLAAPPVSTPPLNYACHIILFAKDLPNGYGEQYFTAPAVALSTHGGKDFNFTFGKYNLAILANARWMGITWYNGTELMAQAVYARGDAAMASQVIMAFNPKDADEYGSLDCDPRN